MINFEEELRKFHPSLELDETSDTIEAQDLYDVSDVIVAMVREKEAQINHMRNQAVRAQAAPVMSMGV